MNSPVIPISTGCIRRQAECEKLLADLTRLHKDAASLGLAHVMAIDPNQSMATALVTTTQLIAIARKHLAAAIDAQRSSELELTQQGAVHGQR